MKVEIKKVAEQEKEQVTISCINITPEIEEIYAYIKAKGKEIAGVEDGQIKRLRLQDVLYFEAVDEKVFVYTRDKTYDWRGRLYEAENLFGRYGFVRCSKSVVMNLMQLSGISPEAGSRFLAHMENGEKIIISRQYVNVIKQKIMGGAKDEA